MAYMSQDKKKDIAAKLKLVVPKGWKYTLGVRHHSTIVMTVKSAPVDLLSEFNRVMSGKKSDFQPNEGYVNVNPYNDEPSFLGSKGDIKNILTALNDGNWDKSDMQTDYFNVGWYVDLKIGTYEKPFTVNA